MSGGGGDISSGPPKPSKFAVYQNPALSAALTTNSLRPSRSTFFYILSLSAASAAALLTVVPREDRLVNSLRLGYFSSIVAYLLAKAIQGLFASVFLGTVLAFIKAISLWRARSISSTVSPSIGTKGQAHLTSRQLGLIGLRPKVEKPVIEHPKKPLTTKSNSVPRGDVLVPLHQTVTNAIRSSQFSGGKSISSSGSKAHTFSTPSKSPSSQSPLYQLPSTQISPSIDKFVSSPWSGNRTSSTKEIATQEELERFLADVGDKITESAGKLATPPPTISGFGIASPNTIATPANTSGTTRSTPLRPVRMSPGSQKFSTPPKKGEGELPPPMSMEESIEAFECMGVHPQIEQWRDQLRQWFSLILLNPLLNKIENSHLKVMDAAAKLGILITVSKVGTASPNTGTSVTVSPIERPNEWKPAISVDEDGLLYQLRATLAQALDASMRSSQQNSAIPIIQECLDAVTEHQRLQALMKGEWAKGLLPKSSVRADYTVQRIQELAEGTCVKNYEYLGNGEVYDKKNRKWTIELPSDSHLLLYLFCAFLEHPKWMLHVDPTSYAGSQSSKNPLFLGVLPPKDMFPEKYVAVVSGSPSVIHPGACILAVGRQSPPIFALYWDKKPQFSLQGRTALWDSILLLCYRIKVAYGGIVRGMHLGSSALAIFPVLESEDDD